MGKRGRVLPFARPEPRDEAEPAVSPAQAGAASGTSAPGGPPPVTPLPQRIPGSSRAKPGKLRPRGGPLPGFPSPALLSVQPDPDRVIESGGSRREPPDSEAAAPGPARPGPPSQPDTDPGSVRMGPLSQPETDSGPPPRLAGEAAASAAPSEPRNQGGTAPQTPLSGPPALSPQPEPELGDPDEPVTGPIVLRPRSEPERRAAQPPATRADSEITPSWGAVAGTTLRLWAQRRRRGWRVAAAIVVALVVFAAGGLTAALLRKGGQGNAAAAGGRPSAAAGSGAVQAATAARQQAAAWVAAQVSHTAVVSCDPAMCAALQAKGFPAGDLMTLGPGSNNPLGSAVIVATAAVRSLFGSRLTSVYAPTAVASFGSGAAQISVRVYAAGGASSYLASLKADEQSRISVGRQLLRNARVSAAPAARQQLVTGQVDSRLLITIATLSGQGPVSIVAFGDSGPGASPGAPLREAELIAPANAKSGYLRSTISLLQAQQQPYLANSVTLVQLANGQQAVRIEFAAPSPLGLLSG
jgi:hypothetical protein